MGVLCFPICGSAEFPGAIPRIRNASITPNWKISVQLKAHQDKRFAHFKARAMSEDFSGYKATVAALLTTSGVISMIGSLVRAFRTKLVHKCMRHCIFICAGEAAY